jgi:hypothetical protein
MADVIAELGADADAIASQKSKPPAMPPIP